MSAASEAAVRIRVSTIRAKIPGAIAAIDDDGKQVQDALERPILGW